MPETTPERVSKRLRLLADLAERAEEKCPDLTREGCTCRRCEFWRPVVTALDITKEAIDA